jgi:hypothetical protein
MTDTTVLRGTFQTPILQNITHGQRNNSRLWHTREDNNLPFHYCLKKVRKSRGLLQCSNHRLSNCPAKFYVKAKKPDYIYAERRPGKDTLFKFNYEKKFRVEDFEVEENSGNFEHSNFCVNQVPLEYRVYDFDNLNSRDKN